MSEAQTKTAKDELAHKIYQAFMAACEKEGGEKEPSSNPWPDHVPFYQVLDLLAGRAAEVVRGEQELWDDYQKVESGRDE